MAVVVPVTAEPVKERDGDVFASRIAAHAECTRRLWRARYLAMRDVRLLVFLFLNVKFVLFSVSYTSYDWVSEVLCEQSRSHLFTPGF